jgi:hypothetical protein
MGQPTNYDYAPHAILDDIQRGTVQTVEFGEEFFNCTEVIRIPWTGDQALNMWEEKRECSLLLPTPEQEGKDVGGVESNVCPFKVCMVIPRMETQPETINGRSLH